ncbi:MAG: glycosyltransferase family 39 protein [Phycisphaerae bacterium]|nr:glycosyltransferase family 39 protein [Phycisphaerae bacterium]
MNTNLEQTDVGKTHWLTGFLQRLGQLTGVTIALGILGYPMLHRHFVGTVSPWLGYLAIALGFGVGVGVFAWRGGLRRVINGLAGMDRHRYVFCLLILSFVLHFGALRIIDALPGAEAPDVYGSWEFFGKDKSAMYPPGDHFVGSAVKFLLGGSPLATILYVSLMVTLACWLVYRLGSIAFGESAGRLAGLLLCILPSWLLYGNLEYDLLLGTLLLLLTYMFFVRPPGTHRWRYLALYGLVLGFSCLVKPICQLFPIVAFVIYLATRLSFVQAIKKTAIITVFMLAAIAPWTIRNYHALGKFVFISTNFGTVLLTANNPDADGREMKIRPKPGEKDEVEVNKRQIREATDWIKSNPASFMKLVAYRVGWLWGTDSSFISNNLHDKVSDNVMNAVRGVVQVFYLAMVLVWVLGLFLFRREVFGSVIGLTCLAPIVYIWGLHLVCQAHGQHHLPVLPFMIILVSGILVRQAGYSTQPLQSEWGTS